MASYNDDETVNVKNLHEAARTNAGDLPAFGAERQIPSQNGAPADR